MNCIKCGVKIETCWAGNENCNVVGHQRCKKHYNRVGLGMVDPCRRFMVSRGVGINDDPERMLIPDKPCAGIGTESPKEPLDFDIKKAGNVGIGHPGDIPKELHIVGKVIK